MAFFCAVPQGLAAYLQLLDRFKAKESKQSTTSGKGRHTLLAFLPLIGTIVTIGFGFWLIYHPIRPVTIEKPVIVEKSVPCPTLPPTKSGNAKTGAANSPAITGSGNAVTYGPPPTNQPPNKKK